MGKNYTYGLKDFDYFHDEEIRKIDEKIQADLKRGHDSYKKEIGQYIDAAQKEIPDYRAKFTERRRLNSAELIKNSFIPESFENRRKIAVELKRSGLDNQARRYIRCGAHIVKFRDQNNAEYLKPFRCESPICPYCMRIRGFKIQNQYREVVKYLSENQGIQGGHTWKMITLTYYKESRGDFLRRIKPSQKDIKNFFRRIRRDFGKDIGMIASMEISKESLLHYHILYYGPFIQQKELSRIWKEITKDSYIVHIEKVTTLDEALKEVLKYATKLNGNLFNGDHKLLTLIAKGLYRVRRILVYGIFYAKLKFVKEKIRLVLETLRNGVKLFYIGLSYMICDKGIFYLEI